MFNFLIVTILAYFVTIGVVYNPLKIFDFNKTPFLTIIINTNFCIEAFVFFAAFIGSWKVMQVYD